MFKFSHSSNSSVSGIPTDLIEVPGIPSIEEPTSEEVSETDDLELVSEPTVAIFELGDFFLPFVFLPGLSEKRVETVSSSGIDSTVCLPTFGLGGSSGEPCRQ